MDQPAQPSSPPDLSPAPKDTPSILPKGSQLFIHPDHEKGTLVIPVDKPKRSFFTPLNLLVLLVSISIVVGSLVAFILFPRMQASNYAERAKEIVGDSSDKISDIHKSLDILYQALTNQDKSTATLSSTKLVSTKEFSLPIFQISDFLINQVTNAMKQSQVKAFSTPAGDPNKIYRNQRDLASAVTDKVSSGKDVEQSFADLDALPHPIAVQSLRNKVKSLSGQTTDFISEAGKTSAYYTALSDTAIEMTNLAESITLSNIDSAINDLKKLKDKFALYPKEKLPSEMKNYNDDIVDVLNVLLVFYKGIQDGSINNQNLLSSYTEVSRDTQSIYTRAYTDELNFWQNNKQISSFDLLIDTHTKTIKDSQDIYDKNKPIFFNLF